jgi:DNA-binding CsgD family transcriptional regulator
MWLVFSNLLTASQNNQEKDVFFALILYNFKMTANITLKNSHVFLTSSPEVDSIVNPLKASFGISSFVYQHNDNDGSEIRLSNQPDWQKHFYDQGFYRISGFEKHPDHYQSGFVVWSHLSHHQPILNAARHFNIDHGMTLIQKNAAGCEFFFIGTTPDKPYVTNLLINNIPLLIRFTAYFKEQAASLIKQAEKERLVIPDKFVNVTSHELGIPYKSTPAHPYNLLKMPDLYSKKIPALSQREIACAKLLLQGKSARLIGEQLFISPRTVETHLQHIKEKLHCRTKAELISRLLDLNFDLL